MNASFIARGEIHENKFKRGVISLKITEEATPEGMYWTILINRQEFWETMDQIYSKVFWDISPRKALLT